MDSKIKGRRERLYPEQGQAALERWETQSAVQTTCCRRLGVQSPVAGLEELVFVPCGHPTGLRGCTQRGQLVHSELCGKHGMDLKASLGISRLGLGHQHLLGLRFPHVLVSGKK